MRELAEREGYDLAQCYAYSDSESDLPMLRAVGNPVAVNPDGALGQLARREGWEIMRLDRLHRRLKILAAAIAAAAAGGAGRAPCGGLRPSHRRARAARRGAAPRSNPAQRRMQRP